MDVGPPGASLAPDVDRGDVVVLRSFGKFFGLAGLRLGFAIAAPAIAARIRNVLGPWAVSGPAIAIGEICARRFGVGAGNAPAAGTGRRENSMKS